MEGLRCVTYSDDGTDLEMFIGLATMEKWWPFKWSASILAHLGILNRYIIIWLPIIHFVWIILVGIFPKKLNKIFYFSCYCCCALLDQVVFIGDRKQTAGSVDILLLSYFLSSLTNDDNWIENIRDWHFFTAPYSIHSSLGSTGRKGLQLIENKTSL